jgi:hypothetical protein
LAHFLECDAGEPGEPTEGAHVEKGEGESSPAHGCGHLVERHTCPLQALNPARSSHITRGEDVSSAGLQDPELDQSVDVTGVDPGLPSHLLA